MSTKGAGGTAGGVGQFFLGLAMAVAGAYLITNQVTVSSGFWGYFGPHTFGLTLLPLVFGIGMLFFDGKSVIGWVLTVGGAVIIFVGVLVNLQIYFRAHLALQHDHHARAAGRRNRAGGAIPPALRRLTPRRARFYTGRTALSSRG